MKTFGDQLRPENLELFQKIKSTRVSAYLRRDLYEFILNEMTSCKNPKKIPNFFDLDGFYKKHQMQLNDEITEQIEKELNDLGWKTKKVFGNTGLQISGNEEIKSWGEEL